MGSYSEAARERVLIYDGAFGTYVQEQPLSADDFGGPDLEGCNELLCLTKPELIADMHDRYLGIGVDAVETATFGAFAVPLAEYGIADQAYEINLAAARIAKEVAHGYATGERPRWVAGSVGPGTKLASLGQIRYAELRDAFEVQARGLLDGGIDLLIIETQYDLLGAKAAINGLPPGHGCCGTRGAAASAGHHRDDRPDAARHRDRRRAGRASAPGPSRFRAELRHRPPLRWASTCGCYRSSAPYRCPASPTPGYPRWWTARCTTTWAPTTWPTTWPGT